VFEEIEGVVKAVPVYKEDPPAAAAYQLIVPADAVAPSTTVPVLQRLAGVVAVIVGIGFTVAITAVRKAPPQLPLNAST
jgi:hypothetical protein